MYMCVLRGIDIVCFSEFTTEFWNCSDGMNFCFHDENKFKDQSLDVCLIGIS
jgi:hypothetical protein